MMENSYFMNIFITVFPLQNKHCLDAPAISANTGELVTGEATHFFNHLLGLFCIYSMFFCQSYDLIMKSLIQHTQHFVA